MTDILNDLREKFGQLKELAGREMDYGSESDAIQNAYILITEALQIIGDAAIRKNAGGLSGSLEVTALISPPSTLNRCRKAFDDFCMEGGFAKGTTGDFAVEWPSFWKTWQAAWEVRELEIEAKEDAMMAMSDSLGVLANE